jgi:hypothetical protein
VSRGRYAGTVNQKVLPRLVVHTHSPPCMVTNPWRWPARVLYLNRLVMVGSSCLKRSKTSSRLFSGRPMPVSETLFAVKPAHGIDADAALVEPDRCPRLVTICGLTRR